MARSKQPNGVADTLERLFGHSHQRSALSKYVQLGLFDKHLRDKKRTEKVFERSEACDHLIRNTLALDAALGKQQLVCQIIRGEIRAVDARREVAAAREKAETKFKAYGYWLNRYKSLDSELESGFNFETSSLEDVLAPEREERASDVSSPYALRAVRLLERVEEDGYLTSLTTSQKVEKAWALYRLGLDKQAVKLAAEITDEHKDCSDAWMLQAIDCQRRQNDAWREQFMYSLQAEEAEALSSHEMWAEEMQEFALDRAYAAAEAEKKILFPALVFWPKDDESPLRDYQCASMRTGVRDRCIEWLFSLLQPGVSFRSNVDSKLAYEANGLGAERSYEERNKPYLTQFSKRGDKPYELSAFEEKAAVLICSEAEEREWSNDGQPDSFVGKLQLLHIQYVMKMDTYEQARARFLRHLPLVDIDTLRAIFNRESLVNALAVHLSSEEPDSLSVKFEDILSVASDSIDASKKDIRIKALRKAYDHAFVRSHWGICIEVARKAHDIVFESEVDDRLHFRRGAVRHKFWRYLELRAAVEMPVAEICSVKSTLLSVNEPAKYFEYEADYMEQHIDDMMDYYMPEYGSSIIENGRWMDALVSLREGSGLSESEEVTASAVIDQLAELKSSHQWQEGDDLLPG